MPACAGTGGVAPVPARASGGGGPAATRGVGHGVERVALAVAVPGVVARTALALLDGAAVGAGERQVAGRKRCRAILRVGGLAEQRGHLAGAQLAVLGAAQASVA